MVRGTLALDDGRTTRAAPVLGQVAALGAAADDEGVALQGHAGEQLLARALDGLAGDVARGRVDAEVVVAHEGCELGVVGAADVDVGEGVGEVEQLVGDAQVRHGFPYEEGFLCARVDGLAFAEDGCDEADAAFWVAEQVEAFGEEESGRECLFVETEFRGAVLEGAVLRAIVAIPAASGETADIIADEA